MFGSVLAAYGLIRGRAQGISNFFGLLQWIDVVIHVKTDKIVVGGNSDIIFVGFIIRAE